MKSSLARATFVKIMCDGRTSLMLQFTFFGTDLGKIRHKIPHVASVTGIKCFVNIRAVTVIIGFEGLNENYPGFLYFPSDF